jgi:hypothetical protein
VSWPLVVFSVIEALDQTTYCMGMISGPEMVKDTLSNSETPTGARSEALFHFCLPLHTIKSYLRYRSSLGI